MFWKYISHGLMYLGTFGIFFGGLLDVAYLIQVLTKKEDPEIQKKYVMDVLMVLICSGLVFGVGFVIGQIAS